MRGSGMAGRRESWRVGGGRRWVSVLAAGALLALGPTACRTAGGAGAAATGDGQAGSQGQSVVVNVRNDNSRDMDVYVVSDGLATRLGTVNALSRAQFTLDGSYFPAAPDFRLVASPIGGNGRASSGHLLVQGGQEIEFTIAPLLRTSSATVR